MKVTFAVANSGCAYWRAKQPCRMIERLGLADVRIFNDLIRPDEIEDYLQWCDVVVMQSPMGIPLVANVAKLQRMGKAVVADYDDLSFAVSPFNPAYKTLGLQSVEIEHSGQKMVLYKDGIDGFEIKANYFRYKSLQNLLKLFQGVTTTGKIIKDAYSPFNENISILPNSIDFNLFRPFPKESSDQIRIGWTPSDSHYVEIWMAKRIMGRIFKKYDTKVKFVVLGNLTELEMEFSPNRMERHNFVGLDTYPMKLASLHFDIGLCPLDDTKFNRAKSQLKWSEYAAMGVPSVVSKLEAYECVEDGVTGMVAENEDEFYEKLCELIDSEALRKKIAANAFDKNFEDYNLEKNIVMWVDAYEQAMERRYALPVLRDGDLQRIGAANDTEKGTLVLNGLDK